jgi:flagellar motor switch protein FliN
MSDEILSSQEADALIAEGTAGDAGPEGGSGDSQAVRQAQDGVVRPAQDRQSVDDTSLTETSVRLSTEPAVRQVEFGQLGYASEGGQKSGVELIMDVNVQVSVELGRSVMQVREVLALGPGSVVELDKHAGEPVEVVVNNKTIARGEVVVIDENFGVRITEIVNAKGKEAHAQAA